MKYNIFGIDSLRDALCKFARINPKRIHTPINKYQWFTDPTFFMQYIGIFQKWPTKV